MIWDGLEGSISLLKVLGSFWRSLDVPGIKLKTWGSV